MQCERTVKGNVCGGEGTPVTSESGEIEWGWKCVKCLRFSEKCQACGRIMRNLAAHIQASPACSGANQAHRTVAMANKVWSRNL
jgi:hypothetical protein